MGTDTDQFWRQYLGRVITSLLVGTTVTLGTGLVPVRSMLGAMHYGLPIPWLYRRVLSPEYSPWIIDWQGFTLSILFWSAITFTGIFVYRSYW